MSQPLAPLPWSIDQESTGLFWTNSLSILDVHGGIVCVMTRGYEGDADGDCPSWENAKLIVAAVNAFGG